jgi:hypothetical protein
MQLFCLVGLLFLFVAIGFKQDIKYTFEHSEGIIPNERKYLSLFFAFFRERIDDFSQGVVENSLFIFQNIHE